MYMLSHGAVRDTKTARSRDDSARQLATCTLPEVLIHMSCVTMLPQYATRRCAELAPGARRSTECDSYQRPRLAGCKAPRP